MEAEPLVPFGKYKGQPITTLLNDTKYLEWCKQQEWFKKFPIVYNICVNQTIVNHNESSKTPEHNRIQNLFLEEENVKKLLIKVFDLRLKHLYIDCDPKYHVKFEGQFNWDLIINRCNYHYCSCIFDENDDNCECVCDTYTNFRTRHKIPKGWVDGKNLENVYCEIKPVLGDDYPCVLRKMNTQIQLTKTYITKESEESKRTFEKNRREYHYSTEEYIYAFQELIDKPNYVLLVKDFSSSITTKEQLIQIFEQSNIKVVFLNDIIEISNMQIQSYSSDNITLLKNKIKQLEEENIMLKEKLKQYETST
jgi:hypothetical protein